jgi:hypothetical protein
MKIITIIFSIVLALFVVVQFNDPDPFIWILAYGLGLFTVLLSLTAYYNSKISLFLVAVYWLWAAFLFPSVVEWWQKENGQNLMQRMVDDKMYIEETRECGGLLIAGLLLLINYWFYRKK